MIGNYLKCFCGEGKLEYCSSYEKLSIYKCNSCNIIKTSNDLNLSNSIQAYKNFLESSNLNSLKKQIQDLKKINKLQYKKNENLHFLVPSNLKSFFLSTGLLNSEIVSMNNADFDKVLNGDANHNLFINVEKLVIFHFLEFIPNIDHFMSFLKNSLKLFSKIICVYRDSDLYIKNYLNYSANNFIFTRNNVFNKKSLDLLLKKNYFVPLRNELLKTQIDLRSIFIKVCNFRLPLFFEKMRFKYNIGNCFNVYEKNEEIKKVSIVVPVYNEAKSVEQLLKSLIKINLPYEKEIIIVESNSNDGSKEIVDKFKNYKNLKVIHQKNALGKGNAVRDGFKYTSGEVIIIQDADLEYDINDYNNLIDPINDFKALFVLGSRSLGKKSWKVRVYDKTPIKGFLMNFAQIIFAKTYNLLFKSKTTDINTMFKVFRRSCLSHMKLTADGFDFDIELACMLAKSGYKPLEVPVNYTSRGFEDGKKINFFKDAIPTYSMIFRCYFKKK